MKRIPKNEQEFLTRRRGQLGHSIQWFDSLPSTSSYLKRLAEEGAAAGLVVAAQKQTQGRGQRDHTWESPLGGLWFSVLLRPQINLSELAEIMPLCGTALIALFRDQFQVEGLSLKFPNDVLVYGQKISGILAETVSEAGEEFPKYLILGIGINVTNSLSCELENTSTRLQDCASQEVLALPQLLAWVLESLESHMNPLALVGCAPI